MIDRSTPASLALISALAACGSDAPAPGPDAPAAEVASDVAGADADAPDAPAPPPTGDPCQNAGTAGATATCLTPTRPEAYYVAEAHAYFDTLDVTADPASVPSYAELVARWEWPPWLLLTGFGREDMIETGLLLKDYDPSTVPERDCRAFPTQPFARCYVVFEYAEGPCPIYEEFTFDDAGGMTFIEAWSDLPGLRPQRDPEDRWGLTPGHVDRLSTRVPGLGTASGRLDLASPWVAAAAAADPDVADFALRAADWRAHWTEALLAAPEDFFAQGCGW